MIKYIKKLWKKWFGKEEPKQEVKIEIKPTHCLTHLRFKKSFKQNPFSLYRALRKLNPSPFLFILNFDNFSIVGSLSLIHI